MDAISQRAYSIGEYFGVEQMSEIKYEYYAGSIYAVAGASINHHRIQGNVCAALHNALHGTSYEPFGSHLRIRTPSGLYTYPDSSVICGEIQYAEAPLQTATNPVALFEVLSDSTRNYDRGDKFEFYRAIPSLRDYVLVEQSSIHVEHRYQNEVGEWMHTLHTNLNDVLELPSLPFRVTLQEIYERVEFAATNVT